MKLAQVDRAAADRSIRLVEEQGPSLRMPLPRSRSPGGGLFEPCFTCQRVARRITYAFAPNRQVIALTTFRKQHDNDMHEISRARATLRQHRQQTATRRPKG